MRGRWSWKDWRRPKPAPRELGCRQTWNWACPPELAALEEAAQLSAYADWLVEIGHADCVSRRELTSLFYEFCVARQVRPPSWFRFDRGLKQAGIVKFRPNLPGRPWRYRVRRADATNLVKLAVRRAA